MSYTQVYPLQISQTMSMSDAYVLVLDAPDTGKQVPVIILTKATWWVHEDWVIGALYAHRELLTIGFTLTGHDELEPGAPANVSRQTALIYLSKMQFRTFASMEPVIDFVSSLAIIRTIASDCQEFRIGLLSPYSKKRYDSAQCERFIREVQRLSKEHNFRILWKESIRRFCREWSICPDLCNPVLGDSVAETKD